MNGALVLAFTLTAAFPLFAADKEGIVVDMKHQKIVKGADGKEKSASAESAKPGDVIEYKAVYRNNGKIAATDVLATIPVPLGTEYLPGSAKPAKVMASLDGKEYASVPLKREVTLPSGKKEMRAVPYEEYRFIRWELKSLDPGKSTAVSLRVRLATDTTGKK
jgi:uncharacterized repeat protein (TIGR01451 family)